MSVPNNPEAKPEISNRIEYYLRRFFERVGGALDFALRRPLNPQVRTDLTALLPQIEQAIEAKLRREGARLIAPAFGVLHFDASAGNRLADPGFLSACRRIPGTGGHVGTLEIGRLPG